MKISLNIIMKDEAAVLLRMLNSVYPIIDYYVAVDTGSTDNSKQIVKDFFDSKNIEGEIYDHPFVDFSDARNFALQQLKGKSDFGFWIDCDEELIIKKEFDLQEFRLQLIKYDIGSVVTLSANTRYSRRNFFNVNKPFKWTGKVHEVLICQMPTHELFIEGLEIFIHPQTSVKQREKYLKHAEILAQEVKYKNNPRDIFYLAQSYRDAGENEKAIEFYQKRVTRDDGFFEEKYYAQFMIGNLYSNIGNTDKAIIEWMKCVDLDSMRAEHFLNIIIALHTMGLWRMAHIFSEYAYKNYHAKNPYPNRVLFLDEATYANKLMQTHLLNCEKTNNKQIIFDSQLSIDNFFKLIPSAWIGHQDFTRWLVDKICPKVTVDLGVDYGYSTFSFALAGKGKVIGIDSFQGDALTGNHQSFDFAMQAIKYLKNKNISNIEIIKSDFDKAAHDWTEKIDILHIDGYHTYEVVKHDYETWQKFLSPDAVVIFHDTESFIGVKTFFNELALPYKFNFKHSHGLGVASYNKQIMDEIELKYGEPKKITREKITLAYIHHDQQVFEKHLKLSMDNLIGDFDTISINSSDAFPAENYNSIISSAKTKYILFVHEDVSFSANFLEKIYEAMDAHPDFGAMGAVGNYKNNIQWGKENQILEVKTVDCCCILINKEHALKFDSETFDEFHLYVDDYCMQASKKGLKNYTIPINASQTKITDVYTPEGCYFRHDSNTCKKLGYCWGKYYEYLREFEYKWSFVDEVDVCIISNAQTNELQFITERGIITLIYSEKNIRFNIFVVESNRAVTYNHFPNTKTIYTDLPFGYHRYLNLAVREGKSEYVCLCNNDLTYEPGWASEIIIQMKKDADILSASPFCPQTQNKDEFWTSVHYGYEVRKELAGWCIFQQRKIYNIIEKLGEDFPFWFCDNDYSMQLQEKKIKHALVINSIVNHHKNNLGISAELILNEDEKNNLTQGQYQKFKDKWNIL